GRTTPSPTPTGRQSPAPHEAAFRTGRACRRAQSMARPELLFGLDQGQHFHDAARVGYAVEVDGLPRQVLLGLPEVVRPHPERLPASRRVNTHGADPGRGPASTGRFAEVDDRRTDGK